MSERLSLIVKIGMTAFLVLYLALLYRADSAKDISLSSAEESLTSVSGMQSLQKRGRADLKRFFSIEETDVDSYIFYKAQSPMSVDEVLILKAWRMEETDALFEKVQAHLSSQETVFGAYGTNQMALLANASVSRRGKYIWYICGPDSQAITERFLRLL